MNFTSSLNYVETLKQDASGSLNLYGSGSTGRTELFSIDGNNGRLFTVSDDLSDSLFSVNTIAGLPVIEAFANNTVVMGQYGTNALVVSGSKVGIGTTTPSEKLDVNGYVKATGFKKEGGTSTQFLMADGSTNSNTYAKTDGTDATGTWGINISGNASKLNPLSGDSNYKLAYTADGARTNAGEWGRAVMYYVPNGQTYGIRVDRADYADNAGTVGGYAASSLWRSDGGTWNPSTNITLNQAANSQEWSFDIYRNGYTGGYWHVWDSANSTMLKVDATSGKVYAPYNFVGNLEGNAATATKLQTARTLTIGNTGKTFDGSANVSWTLAEIGAQAAGSYAASSHTHDDRYYTETESDARFLRYYGVNAENDFQRFQDGVGEIRFDQINDYNNLSNAPGGYNFGGVLSMRGDNFGFQIWGSHTGDLYYKTQWSGDNYTGWRSIITSGNIASQSVNYASSAGSIAWSNVSGRPTNVSSFTNDSGYITGGYLSDFTSGNLRFIADYGSNTTWFIRSNGQFIFGNAHDWTQSFRLSLSHDSTDNGTWAYFGQQDSNATNGRYRGVRIRKYAGGTTTDGDLSAGAFYIGTTRKDTNWDTAYSWGNHASAGYATASGTVNYIPKFTASGAIGNSLIYDNGTYIGIGTNTPTATLEVSSSNYTGIAISRSIQNAGVYIQAKGYDTGNIYRVSSQITFDQVSDTFWVNGGISFATASSGSLVTRWKILTDGTFQSNGAGKIETSSSNLTLNAPFGDIYLMPQSTKNVGIGTTTPSYKLDVNGSTRITGTIQGAAMPPAGTSGGAFIIDQNQDYHNSFSFYSRNDTDQDGFGIVDINASPEGGIYFASKTLDNSIISSISFDHSYFTLASGGNFYFNTKPSTSFQTSLFIKKTGEVGIGTIFPSEKLDVNGNIKAIDIIDQQGISIYLKLKTVNGNVTIDNSYHNKIVRITASCTITIPAGLRTDFNCTFEVIGAYTAQFVDGSGATTSAPFGRYLKTDLTAMFYCTGTASNYRLNGSLATS